MRAGTVRELEVAYTGIAGFFPTVAVAMPDFETLSREGFLAKRRRLLGSIAALFGQPGREALDLLVTLNHGQVICRPWQRTNRGLFAKSDFDINIRDRTITCPQGQTQRFEFGTTVSFDAP